MARQGKPNPSIFILSTLWRSDPENKNYQAVLWIITTAPDLGFRTTSSAGHTALTDLSSAETGSDPSAPARSFQLLKSLLLRKKSPFAQVFFACFVLRHNTLTPGHSHKIQTRWNQVNFFQPHSLLPHISFRENVVAKIFHKTQAPHKQFGFPSVSYLGKKKKKK